MKVSEAKEKVCPFMSNSQDIDLGNGYVQKGHYSKCICGDCMAWQFQELKELVEFSTKGNRTKGSIFVDCDHESEHGYCRRIGK